MTIRAVRQYPRIEAFKTLEDSEVYLRKLLVALQEEAVVVSTFYQTFVIGAIGDNIGIGAGVLASIATGIGNIAFGSKALYSNTTGAHNVAVGYQALMANTSGYRNVAIGYQTLLANTEGYGNIGIGVVALDANTSGDYNIAIGDTTLTLNTSGEYNIAIGRYALFSNTTANHNTAIGFRAGYSCETGADNVFLGHDAGFSETGSNKLYIANSITATPLIGGVFPNVSLTFTSATTIFSGNVGIGTATPSDELEVLAASHPTVLIHGTGSTSANLKLQVDGGSRKNWVIGNSITTASALEFYNEDDTATRMLIDSAGNVGIGTATPARQVEIEGAAPLLMFDGSAAGQAHTIGVDATGFVIWNDDAAGYRLQINNAGLVTLTGNLTMSSAISTITGGTKLNIEAGATGVASLTVRDDTSAGAATIGMDYTPATFYRSTSARKYKDKIKDLELDSSLIYDLRPVSFNSLSKRDDKDKRWIGLIADEVEQVYPEIIHYNENNEAENYDNKMLLTLMLKESQNQNQRIEALEARFNN